MPFLSKSVYCTASDNFSATLPATLQRRRHLFMGVSENSYVRLKPSLVPRPSARGEEEGLVHTACACA